jgi:hypothetical protein
MRFNRQVKINCARGRSSKRGTPMWLQWKFRRAMRRATQPAQLSDQLLRERVEHLMAQQVIMNCELRVMALRLSQLLASRSERSDSEILDEFEKPSSTYLN